MKLDCADPKQRRPYKVYWLPIIFAQNNNRPASFYGGSRSFPHNKFWPLLVCSLIGYSIHVLLPWPQPQPRCMSAMVLLPGYPLINDSVTAHCTYLDRKVCPGLVPRRSFREATNQTYFQHQHLISTRLNNEQTERQTTIRFSAVFSKWASPIIIILELYWIENNRFLEKYFLFS